MPTYRDIYERMRSDHGCYEAERYKEALERGGHSMDREVRSGFAAQDGAAFTRTGDYARDAFNDIDRRERFEESERHEAEERLERERAHETERQRRQNEEEYYAQQEAEREQEEESPEPEQPEAPADGKSET